MGSYSINTINIAVNVQHSQNSQVRSAICKKTGWGSRPPQISQFSSANLDFATVQKPGQGSHSIYGGLIQGLIKSKKLFDVEHSTAAKKRGGGLIQVKKNIFLMFNIRLQKQVKDLHPPDANSNKAKITLYFLQTSRLPDAYPTTTQGIFKQGQNLGVLSSQLYQNQTILLDAE